MCGRKIIDHNRKKQQHYTIQTGYDYDYIGVAARQIFNIVRSLSGKNWQDRDKADKVSISFPATPKDN